MFDRHLRTMRAADLKRMVAPAVGALLSAGVVMASSLGAPLDAAATPPPAASVNGVPLCDGQDGRPAHDPARWHPLLAYNPDGSVLCTYGHDHGMDPSQLDSVFGPLPLQQQISYSWQTISATGVPENATANKHRVYKWLAAPALACSTGRAPDGSSRMVTAFREELHADGNLGAAVRFHSFWGQYRLTDCASGDTGTLAIGGHMDYARLRAGETDVPLPIDPPTTCTVNGDTRQEGSTDGPEQRSSVWYGSNSRPPGCDDAYGFGPHVAVQVNVGTDGWGPVDPTNPTAVAFYPNRDQHHGTRVGTDALTIWLSGFPTDGTGHVTFTGHVDRHGNVVPEVAGQAPGIDYIPLVIEHAEPGAYGTNGPASSTGDAQSLGVGYDGDVPGPSGEPGYYVQTPDQS